MHTATALVALYVVYRLADRRPDRGTAAGGLTPGLIFGAAAMSNPWRLPAAERLLTGLDARREAGTMRTADEESVRALYHPVPQGAICLDSSGTIIAANPGAETLLGVPWERARTGVLLCPECRATDEDGSALPSGGQLASTALRTGREVHEGVAGVFDSAAQSLGWLKLRAVPQFRPAEARPYRILAACEDITRLREYERGLALWHA